MLVFVENHDSFSWNVLDLLPVAEAEVRVVEGDTPEARAAVEAPETNVVVIGPGPMDPIRAGLVDLVERAARRRVPTLGICLGHQALGLAYGATLVRSTPAHGQRARVHFSDSRHFINGDFDAMRYHSLSLGEVKGPLRALAHLADGTVMAVEHATLPMAGLQFHPDSHGTPRGRELVEAFFRSIA